MAAVAGLGVGGALAGVTWQGVGSLVRSRVPSVPRLRRERDGPRQAGGLADWHTGSAVFSAEIPVAACPTHPSNVGSGVKLKMKLCRTLKSPALSHLGAVSPSTSTTILLTHQVLTTGQWPPTANHHAHHGPPATDHPRPTTHQDGPLSNPPPVRRGWPVTVTCCEHACVRGR